jgi:hypothetical protein
MTRVFNSEHGEDLSQKALAGNRTRLRSRGLVVSIREEAPGRMRMTDGAT